ncbi:MAG TPA: exodeoxyribonuclease VII large subunit [Clostridia bacterium]|jgi:exodeoxyribonuclease VII large subunit|nr:exodeoxyribonuclease VII large subunit [Clostridiaceae bacterium]HPZ51563.1 exodeoxyribonuclease VII large subunit [Clostridia bacterium]
MDKYFTVSQINSYIKTLLQNDRNLTNIWIVGEISNYKLHTTGHSYFTLKDPEGLIRCVMFRSRNLRLKFQPENGMKVLAYGSVSVYERDGSYQFYVDTMEPFGLGALHIAYEQLKEKLQKEGLFDSERKKKIPFLPSCIGVVTSKSGSVIKDIMNVTYRRFPTMKIVLFPVQVQGEMASYQVENALKLAERLGICDVLIVARGGGSMEELWAFNEERTVRAISECSIPVISAVGHETDFTLSDFAADLRAPTPSAAAELAVPELRHLKYTLETYFNKIQDIPLGNILLKRKELDRVKHSAVFRRPLDIIQRENMNLGVMADKLNSLFSYGFEMKKQRFNSLNDVLYQLDPYKILERGYSVARKKDGKVIDSVSDISEGEVFEIHVKDGSFDARRENNNE